MAQETSWNNSFEICPKGFLQERFAFSQHQKVSAYDGDMCYIT